MNILKDQRIDGFTIVELLIVVVVIGILAAITIIAFNGVQNSAIAASLQSDLRNAGMKLETTREQTGNGYPANTDDLKVSSGTIFEYTHVPVDNYYCLSAYADRPGVSSYFIDSTTKTVTEGLCPGHGPTTSGFSWTEQTTLGTKLWKDVAISADGSIIAGVSNYGYNTPSNYADFLYISTDSGATWAANTDLGAYATWTGLAMNTDGSTIVAIADGSMHVSSNAGQSWTERAKPSGVLSWKKASVSSNGARIVALGVIDGSSGETRVFTSSNAGASWTQRSTPGLTIGENIASSSDGMRLIVSDGATWVTNAGHVYTSTDYGATWTERTGTSGGGISYGVASSADGTKLFVGKHYGSMWRSGNSGATWQSTVGSHSIESLSTSADGTQVIAGGNTVTHSTDSGTTWAVLDYFPVTHGHGQRVALSQDGTRYVVAGWGTHLYTGTYTP